MLRMCLKDRSLFQHAAQVKALSHGTRVGLYLYEAVRNVSMCQCRHRASHVG